MSLGQLLALKLGQRETTHNEEVPRQLLQLNEANIAVENQNGEVKKTHSQFNFGLEKWLYQREYIYNSDHFAAQAHNILLVAATVEKAKGLVSQLDAILQQNPLLWLGSNKNFLLDTKKKIVWHVTSNSTSYNASEVNKAPKPTLIQGDKWVLPTISELRSFAKISTNPMRTSNGSLQNDYYWLGIENNRVVGIDLEPGYESSRPDSGDVTHINRQIAESTDGLLTYLLKNQLPLSTLMAPEKNLLDDLNIPLSSEIVLQNIDYARCRLPKLEPNQITDINKGLWEFWGLDTNTIPQLNAIARNPEKDIQHGNIGIDFGTSSTVVAYEDDNGRPKLLRIGVDDYYASVQPDHYENPTVLEFLDFQTMLSHWQDTAQQPFVNWDTVRCSHEALHNLRNNDSNAKIVGSVLSKIKQWALRESDEHAVTITDQLKNFEHELPHLSLRNPVKGSALTVDANYEFDPVELYAWFLGLNINWRNRGLFLKYYMTFPVAYSKEVKNKILSSFRRGLWRSLPESLVNQSEIMERFSVEERASEPAAYAASAMLAHDIEPTENGVAYAVFDFGGGTTDFDFGYYRLATDEEESKGIEEIFEHFESAGDKFLGGENLLENMAYLVFRDNLDLCREHRIPFTRPLDADSFAGSEMLVDKTQVARTNTLMLMSQLRPIWEKEAFPDSGMIGLGLLARDGSKKNVELTVKKEVLSDYLDNRIQQGIKDFFIAMRKAFGCNLPRQVHILLAGNSSRSKRVSDAFGLLPENADELSLNRSKLTQGTISIIFSDACPEIISHAPLLAKADNESIPTAKTGVALGILRLCPGSSTKVINRSTQQSDGEAPFAFYVGRGRRNQFVPSIKRNDAYGSWHELGVVSEEAVFNMYYTQSNLALDKMDIGHTELYKRRLDFTGSCIHHKVFARPNGPASVYIVTAESEEALKANEASSVQKIKLM